MDSNLSYRGTKAQDFEASRAHSLSHLRQAKRHLPRCYGYRGSTLKATEAARCVRAWARAIMHDLGHYSQNARSRRGALPSENPMRPRPGHATGVLWSSA